MVGANVGERRESPTGAPRLAGIVERVHQDRISREVMLRLEEPCEGIALIGAYTWDGQTRGAASLYLYGEDAARIVDAAREEWASWLQRLLKPT